MPSSERLHIKCDGVTIPHAPLEVDISTFNISSDDTGRNQNAQLIQKIIRFGVQKVELTFSGLTDTQIQQLYAWTKSYGGGTGTQVYVNLTYKDPRTKLSVTKKGYWGAETQVTWVYDNKTNLLTEGFTLIWIEA